jgi:hypothetical protein
MEVKELRVTEFTSDRARGNCKGKWKTYREILEVVGTTGRDPRNRTQTVGKDISDDRKGGTYRELERHRKSDRGRPPEYTLGKNRLIAQLFRCVVIVRLAPSPKSHSLLGEGQQCANRHQYAKINSKPLPLLLSG